MVKQVQVIEEYYDEDDDDYGLFYAPDSYDYDEQLVLLACLLKLKQVYDRMQSMTPQMVLDEIDDITKNLKSDLKDTAIREVHNVVFDYFSEVLSEYSIPQSGYVKQDTSMDKIIKQSIDTLCNQLRDELKLKSMHFDSIKSKGTFSILPNFKRAVQKLIDGVGGNLLYSKEKSERNVLDFVYTDDTLWIWVTKGDSRVCGWCREQEAMPPRRLRDMPYDHLNGRCKKAPVNAEYTEDYSRLISARF